MEVCGAEPVLHRVWDVRKKDQGQLVICYVGFLIKLDSYACSVIIVHMFNAKPWLRIDFEYGRCEEEKIKPIANLVVAYFFITFSYCNNEFCKYIFFVQCRIKVESWFLPCMSPCPVCISYKKIIQLSLIQRTSVESSPWWKVGI